LRRFILAALNVADRSAARAATSGLDPAGIFRGIGLLRDRNIRRFSLHLEPPSG
jgi:hypothetical protein